MKRRYFLCIAFCIVVGLSACTTLQPPPRLEPAKACADWRWIAIKKQPEAECPKVPGWTESRLFSTKDLGQQPSEGYGYKKVPREVPSRAVIRVIRELERFCVYEIEGRHKKLKQPPFPPAVSSELVRFDQDCAILSPSGGRDLEAKIWEPLYRRFLSQTGRTGAPPKVDEKPGVRLAFLDTQPTDTRVPKLPGNSRHGYTLAHIARQLVCTPGDDDHCAAKITTQLALPILKFRSKSWAHNQRDTQGGGFIGLQTDLAHAIEQEVNDWKTQDPELHLVLNLSLAWDGELFGGLDEENITEVRAGTQAVYRALQYAYGHGALVLTAAGNQKHRPCLNTGPLLPAAWEKRPPKEEVCSEAGPAQLLYAVGGVRSDGSRLENSRPGGMPRRAAYADSAVVASLSSRQPTEMLTGSSVATAVVSSVAAVVWDAFPHLDAYEVMEILDASGDVLDYPADFWFEASVPPNLSPPKVHRISLCSALAEACTRTGAASCPVELPCAPWPREGLALVSPLPTTAATGGSCQPWMIPQPEDDPCPTCPPSRVAALPISSPAPSPESFAFQGWASPGAVFSAKTTISPVFFLNETGETSVPSPAPLPQ